MMNNEDIVNYLIADVEELIPQQEALDINDGFGDYLMGIIQRSQSVLRMMGVPEERIPQNGDC